MSPGSLYTPTLARAVALNLDLAPGWRLLGDIALFSGRFPAAQGAYDRSLAASMSDPRLKKSAAGLAEGRLDVAEHEARSVLA